MVLNPIPDAVRKAYSGLLCFGGVQRVSVDSEISFGDIPDNLDKRYVDAVVQSKNQQFIIPKLAALGVAFSYF